MTADFDRLAGYIDGSAGTAAELQALLTARPALAPESGGEGELAKCLALESWLKASGVSRLERFDAPDPRIPSGIRPNLVATVPGREPRALWVIAHLDVVPEGARSLWSTDPWQATLSGGRIYGRGTEDNQQGLVSGALAALAFIKTGVVPRYTLKLLCAADEETGSRYGIRHLLAHCSLFRPDDLIIIPDGGDPQGQGIEVAEKNLLWLRVTAKGRQAHGSRPDEGNNAFLAGSALALSLNGLERVFDRRDELFTPPYSTFQPTKKEANVPNVNTIPGEDAFFMDCRILPCYPLDAVRAEVAKRLASVGAQYGVEAAAKEEQAVESPATPSDAPVVRLLAAAIKAAYGVDARPVGIGGGTVGAYLRKAGFPAVVWSRIDERAHQPNEYCVIDNLLGDAKALAAVASGYAG